MRSLSHPAELKWFPVGCGKRLALLPLHIVMPITVKPTKPCMLHDERFLNLWIKKFPFTLDYVTNLRRCVHLNRFQTTIDDKSRYSHVPLHPSRSTYFGLQWNDFYFTCTSIPFGWKASAYMDLMALSSYARFFSPFLNPGSSGTNVFAQMLEPFVFPPFIRMGPLLNFMSLQPCSFTIIVPGLCPKHHWWPILLHRASSHLKLGSKGQKDILLFPDLTFSGSFTSRSLQWDLWAFRVLPDD